MTAHTSTRAEYLSCAEIAAVVRSLLKKAYPKVTFSARSKTYSGGASITVRWTDGPTPDAVEKLVCHLRGATFDGSIDLKGYADPVRLPDGRMVRSGADYIFMARSISPALTARTAATVTDQYGIAPGDDIHAIAHTLPYPLSRCWTFDEVVQQVAYTTATR
jgi:hypothetical protein